MLHRRRMIARLCFCLAFAGALLVTGSLNAAPAPAGERATRILVEKSARTLSLLRNGTIIKSYRMALGGNPVGTKRREGDSKTPEGRYKIDFKNNASRFHLSLRISYPDAEDRKQAAAAGAPPGGDIFIHGLPNGLGWLGAAHRARDWTDGCIAVTNEEIEEIWSLVETGTPIEIRP